MKKISLFLLFLAIQLSAFATNVQGIISSSTIWTKANSPYIVNGHLLVSTGILLTLEPGVEVRVDPNYNFYVEGSIYAKGTANAPITFTSNLPDPDGYQDKNALWKGIVFRNNSINDSALFQYCTFKYIERISGGPLLFNMQYSTVNYAGGIEVYGKAIFNKNN